jgi:hypothetical protein
MAADAGFINAPIPGMSLTTEPGNRPWENPPMLVTVEDALEFYANKIVSDFDNHDALLEMLELRMPVQNVANLLQKTSIMEGFHTIDVGILVMPAIEEMIMAVADLHGVKYAASMDEVMEGFVANPRAARLAMQDLERMMAEPEEETSLLEPVEAEQLPTEQMGLMARPQKGMVE